MSDSSHLNIMPCIGCPSPANCVLSKKCIHQAWIHKDNGEWIPFEEHRKEQEHRAKLVEEVVRTLKLLPSVPHQIGEEADEFIMAVRALIEFDAVTNNPNS